MTEQEKYLQHYYNRMQQKEKSEFENRIVCCFVSVFISLGMVKLIEIISWVVKQIQIHS